MIKKPLVLTTCPLLMPMVTPVLGIHPNLCSVDYMMTTISRPQSIAVLVKSVRKKSKQRKMAAAEMI
jgi:hypothetical protein